MTPNDADRGGQVNDLARRRRSRHWLVATAIFVLAVVVYIAWASLVPFIVGIVIAYLFLPLVGFAEQRSPRWLQQKRLARPLSIVIVYLLMLGLAAGVVSVFVPLVSEQAAVMKLRAPVYYEQVRKLFFQVFDLYQRVVPEDWQVRMAQSFQQALANIDKTVQAAVTRVFTIVTQTIGVILGLLVVPFWMFYVLNDTAHLTQQFFSLIPPRYRRDVYNVQRIMDDVLGSYIRGQLLLCFFIGAFSVIGLLFLGVDFALLLGTIAGVFEVVPYVGPIIGAIPAVVVAFMQSPILGFWVMVLFIGIQQVENLLLVPRITGGSVRLSPALVMLVLVVGSGIGGIWGMLVAIPVTAVCRDVFRYLYMRLSDQEVPCDEAYARVKGEALEADVQL
ncbi:MAG: AI-2E family transporter [Anaerolineae bacterium]|nr:AI-2E family transporter [Anaerolineae bacterium]